MSLSVVISTKSIDPNFRDHVKKSSGIKDIEILMYENPNGISLTEIYNKGLNESKNDVVVFCHDDIFFNKNGWAKKLLKTFKNTNYGILGVAGSTYMPSSGKWWEDFSKMVGFVKHSKDGKTWDSKYSSKFDHPLRTCCVDGVFFACKKERIKKQFDESFGGFHFYDIDFSFGNHVSGVEVGVTFDVELTHKSIGMTNDEWENNRKIFIDKYTFYPNTEKPCLPLKIKSEIFYNKKEIRLKTTPKVEVIIPNINNYELITNCVNSFLEKSSYPNIKITIADTGSEGNILKKIEEFCNSNGIKLIKYDYYHFEKINNDVVKNHLDEDTELILFTNNDIELINDCVTEMVNLYLKNKNNCGTIGARLYFENNTIQHAGIEVLGTLNRNNQVGVRIGHVGFRSEYSYPQRNLVGTVGNTAALQMISKELFFKLGLFPEYFIDSLSDVEFNLKCTLFGKKNCFATNAVAYHFESKTREADGKIKEEDYFRVLNFIKDNKQIMNKLKFIRI